MKRWLFMLAMFAAVVGVIVGQTGRGQIPPPRSGPNDIGPGDGGATLRLPDAYAPSPAPQGPVPGALNDLWKGQANPFTPATPATRVAQLPSNPIDMNKDIEITDKQGPWVILVMSYAGPEAPAFAREFALEMRKTFKLNAYIFNYGAAEKRQEYERVEKLKQEYADKLKAIPGKSDFVMPTRIRAVKIDEQTGVLLTNNYRSREEALNALKELRNKFKDIDAEFAKRVKLDVTIAMVQDQDKAAKSGLRVSKTEARYVNPFKSAFPVRNPAVTPEQAAAAEIDPVDLKLMHTLNANEPLSLFQVKKPFTLVIKQYNTQTVIVRSKAEERTFDRVRQSLAFKSGDWADYAGIYAHNLADAFRKSGLAETYVLHAKYCSFVTVGSFDSVEEPRMKQMQDFLESRFQMNEYRPIQLLERPAPMAVPH